MFSDYFLDAIVEMYPVAQIRAPYIFVSDMMVRT